MKTTAVLILTAIVLTLPVTTQGQELQTTVLDFEQVPPPSSTSQLFGFVQTPYHEDGFVIESQPGLFIRSVHPSQFYAGSTAVFNDYRDDLTTLREGNGRPFRLVSVRLSRLLNNDSTIYFTGLTSSGEFVRTSFFRPSQSQRALTTEFFPSGFNDLLEVRWEQGLPGQTSGSMQVDDFTLIVVPEPSICPLLLLAMFSGNLFRKR